MVSMYVRVDDVAQLESHRSGDFEITAGIIHCINGRPSGMTATAEEIRRGNHRIGVQKLTQYYEGCPPLRRLTCLGAVSRSVGVG